MKAIWIGGILSNSLPYVLDRKAVCEVFKRSNYVFRPSPNVCVKSDSQSSEHMSPQIEPLCARFVLHKFLGFICSLGRRY
jgi:hypothetical protein